MTDFRETFTYRGRAVGELVIPAELLDEDQRAWPESRLTVTTEISRRSWWWFRATNWLRSDRVAHPADVAMRRRRGRSISS